jgi:hypothetical protein
MMQNFGNREENERTRRLDQSGPCAFPWCRPDVALSTAQILVACLHISAKRLDASPHHVTGPILLETILVQLNQRNLPGHPFAHASNILPACLPFLAGPWNIGQRQRSHSP